jgi:hypothetical protein
MRAARNDRVPFCKLYAEEFILILKEGELPTARQ